jgi:hypothetical protein
VKPDDYQHEENPTNPEGQAADLAPPQGGPGVGTPAENAGPDRRGVVLVWEAHAEVGNANGVFDAAYDFGEGVEGLGNGSSELVGTAEDVGRELARLLASLTKNDVTAMEYGTGDFFLQVTVRLRKDPGRAEA